MSTIKHTHHGFDMDRPGKDSFRHREAGAYEVLVSSGTRWALLHENEGLEPGLSDLLRILQPVDLVIVEGFKTHPGPKLEVYRPSLGKAPLWPHTLGVAAVAADTCLPDCDRPQLPLDEPAAVAEWIVSTLQDLPE